LQFKDETFDYILALDVVEHIDMDYEVLKEFFRVLKQNGKVFITVPANPWLFSGHDVALEHKRRYTRRSLKKLLLSQNFSICELGFWNFILFPLAVVKRLLSPQKKPKIDSTKISPLLDKILFKILKIEETAFLLGIKAPFGLSLFSVLLKSKKS
jgi:ubiquinone/menaquinone biosynthesis C-methylase UbiE